VTPGEGEWAGSELERADAALDEARQLLGSGLLEGAASRLYYAVFHAARASLAVRGLHAKTHSGQITLFERTFEPAPLLGDLFKLRIRADYALQVFSVSRQRLDEELERAAAFIERCRTTVSEALARGADQPNPPPAL